jgi:hypothetical protein
MKTLLKTKLVQLAVGFFSGRINRRLQDWARNTETETTCAKGDCLVENDITAKIEIISTVGKNVIVLDHHDNMMRFFTIPQLIRSQRAIDNRIENLPDYLQIEALVCLTVNLLDPLREKWGRPLTVVSGFRNPKVNSLVGGSDRSDHMTGRAVDITAGSPELNRQLFEMIKENFCFDQMYGITGRSGQFSSVHVSFRATGNRNQIIRV